MRNIFRPVLPASPRRSQRGSALLIVLGFLSFMIISAVSFAIYMRIERQASSNYRHSVAARHLLNSALFRAIDDVDAELRLKDTGYFKFPEANGDNWPGRVKASAVEDAADNAQDAHVLSLEALSFLPSFLINDVRRYAARDSSDNAWMGAKWRPMDRAMDGDVVGRYAYVCVNLSDMLDVNQCKALARDSYTNRVSLGHLFADNTERENFDEAVRKDIRYLSLQDFYNARYERYKTADSSPYHAYLNSATPNQTFFGNANNQDQVFCTDSIVKPEPTNGVACNIVLNQPFDNALLYNVKPDITSLAFKTEPSMGGTKPFWRALQETVDGVTWNLTREQMMTALIKDYIDPDPVPTQLSMPCVEMVPMISQIVINRDIMKAQVFDKTIASAGPGKPETKQYGVRLINQNTMSGGKIPLYVEVVWPFKYFDKRSLPSFKIRGVWCFKIVKSSLNTHSPELLTGSYQFDLDSADVNLSSFSQTSIAANQDACYQNAILVFDAPTPAQNEVLLLNEDGSAVSSFAPADSIRVACTMWLQVVTTYNGVERVVDQVPCMADDPTLTRVPALALWKASTPKLYFQTDGVPVNTLASRVGQFIEYQANNSLECPDPRFNFNAINWIGASAASGTTDAQMNQSTRDILADGTGRDRDLFMSVSDTGVLQSPGELGYIIRPYNWDVSYGVTVDFAVQNKVSAMSASNRDKDAMFRTFRLYDHSASLEKDDIYENFFCMEADGTLKGARVNPLSDLPEVLEAAIWDTPLDYWFASTNTTALTKQAQTFNQSVLHFNNDAGKWEDFRDAWADALDVVTPEVNKGWNRSISDYYGDWQYFKWYSDDVARKSIFNGFTLDNPLHEIDRKMLYSFSLESFSDRQQLFLYILRAEATSPSFGSSADSGMRSLAGGRAVALVWRDPYPSGYKKSANTWDKRTGVNGWYPDNAFNSPWKQYAYMGNSKQRWDSYHDTRILFFKQLDQ